jgi:hypothetical protein
MKHAYSSITFLATYSRRDHDRPLWHELHSTVQYVYRLYLDTSLASHFLDDMHMYTKSWTHYPSKPYLLYGTSCFVSCWKERREGRSASLNPHHPQNEERRSKDCQSRVVYLTGGWLAP